MRLLTIVVLVLMSSGGETDDALMERASALLQPLKSQLMGELRAGMEKGPVSAIEVCRQRAPEIANALQSESVELGRTSHRLRNPENAPRAWVEPILERFVSDPSSARPVVVELGRGRVGYVEPIMTQPLCLVCHGEKIAEPVRERIEELYPEDRATGFAAGEMRGVFWVEIARE